MLIWNLFFYLSLVCWERNLAHVHLFLLIVIADCKLLINPRVDPFFSLLSLLKTTMKICFFLLLSTVFWLLKSWLVFVSKCQYLWLKYIVESQYWMNENHHWTSRHQSLKTSVWFNGSSVFGPQLSFFYRIVEKISCNKGSCDSFIVIIGYLN